MAMSKEERKARRRIASRKYYRENRDKVLAKVKERQRGPIRPTGQARTVVCDVCGKEFETKSACAKRHPPVYDGKPFNCTRLGRLRSVKAWQKRNPGWSDKYNKKRRQGSTRVDKLPKFIRDQQTIHNIRQLQQLPAEQWCHLIFER